MYFTMGFVFYAGWVWEVLPQDWSITLGRLFEVDPGLLWLLDWKLEAGSRTLEILGLLWPFEAATGTLVTLWSSYWDSCDPLKQLLGLLWPLVWIRDWVSCDSVSHHGTVGKTCTLCNRVGVGVVKSSPHQKRSHRGEIRFWWRVDCAKILCWEECFCDRGNWICGQGVDRKAAEMLPGPQLHLLPDTAQEQPGYPPAIERAHRQQGTCLPCLSSVCLSPFFKLFFMPPAPPVTKLGEGWIYTFFCVVLIECLCCV